jgi:hypothetical protein
VSTPTELVELPDVELILTTYLRAAIDPSWSATVGLTVPTDDDIFASLPFARVARFAGPGDHLTRFDRPVVDIDVWHTTNELVNAFGRHVRGVMAAARGLVGDGYRITRVAESTGPQRLPEDNPQLVRLGFAVALTVRAT